MIRIEDLNDSRVDIFTKYNEAQLLHYYEPDGGVFIAETPVVIERALDRGCAPEAFLIEEEVSDSDAVRELVDRCCGEVDVFVAPLQVINKITGYNLTRGVLCAMRRPELPTVSDLLKSSKRVAVLEDVMNPTNVGAIFRSAAALGVDAIFLTKPCADPFYRRASRVAMGTAFQIPWTYIAPESDWCDTFHENGYKIVSMALTDDAVSLAELDFDAEEKVAIVFGTESTGIKAYTLEKSDYVAIIPMQNGVDSLNVAAASAVAFWEINREAKVD